jgi:transcriptional regulator with XRE-family HTH domain
MINAALRSARLRAHMSQAELARRIQEAGFRAGDANGCTPRMVQRWESGEVKRPQGRYLLALESVLGQPAENLGFDADIKYGMDRSRTIAEAGLDSMLPLPDPAEYSGPLTGIWLSEYAYPSTGRGARLSSRHYAVLLQRGARLLVRSVPASKSRLSMDLSVNGQVVTGVWTEQTEAGGYYKGAVYHGALQLLGEPTGRRLSGMWVGFGRDREVNTGPWTLTMVEEHADRDTLERWNRVPEETT